MIHFFVCALFLFNFSVFSETRYQFRADSPNSDLDLQRLFDSSQVRPSPILYQSDAVIIPADIPRGRLPYFTKLLPYTDSPGVRILFAFDSLRLADPRPVTPGIPFPHFKFFLLSVADLTVREELRTLIVFYLVSIGKEWFLHPWFQGDDIFPQAKTDRRLFQLSPGTPYGLETMMKTDQSDDSLSLAVRLNGSIIRTSGRLAPVTLKKQVRIVLGNYAPAYSAEGSLHFDNIAYGSGWQGSVPLPSPGSVDTGRYLPGRLILPKADFLDPLGGSGYWSTQCLIQVKGEDWTLPLFDTGPDTSGSNEIYVKSIDLDPEKEYQYRFRHFNREGNAGDWSGTAPILFDKQAILKDQAKRPRLLRVFYANPGNDRPVRRLVRGKPYDLVIKTRTPGGWNHLGYCLAWANNSEYTEGGIKNKGGKFKARSNYIYNISAGPLKVFEKSTENSYQTTLLVGRKGRYIDPTKGGLKADTAAGILRIRTTFGDEAVPGRWSLRALAFQTDGANSPLVYDDFILIDKPDTPRKPVLLIFLALLALGLAGLFVILWMKKRKAGERAPEKRSKAQEMLNRVTDYIKANISKDLRTTEIEEVMGMSQANLYKIIKQASGLSLKQRVLNIKLDRAKELFMVTNKDVAEVMMDVGFTDPAHFSRMFKKHTGQSPLQFKKARR